MRYRLLAQMLGTFILLMSIIVLIAVGFLHPFSHYKTTAARNFPGLSVKGVEIVAGQNHNITLIGATRSSLEYFCAGDGHFQPTDFAAMHSWGMNVVRITLSSEFWANHDASCPTYRQTVSAAVANAESQNLYVILDLQWNAPLDLAADRAHGGAQCSLPDAHQDVAFWQDIASIYHNDHHVMFDLFGEPHDVSWNTWYYGGTIVNGCYAIPHSGAVSVEFGKYTAIGMRDLIAIVHDIAPEITLIVAGLDWGYDLSQVETYPFAAKNIIYDTHPFPFIEKMPLSWDHDFGDLTGHAAVIADEFGSYDCQTAYTAQAIAYFNAHHMSWLAWAWNPGTCYSPTLIANWSGAPTSPYGKYIHDEMLAASKLNNTRNDG